MTADRPGEANRPGESGTAPSDTGACANCGRPLAGEFCATCGQSAKDIRVPVVSLVLEAADGIFAWDGRLFATFRRLYTRPGRVGRDYVEGKRVSHTPPVKLYLLVSLAFFLAVSALGVRVLAVIIQPTADIVRAQDPDTIAERRASLEAARDQLDADPTGIIECGVEPGPDEIAPDGGLIRSRDTGAIVTLFQFGAPPEGRRLPPGDPDCAEPPAEAGWGVTRLTRLALQSITDPAGFEARVNAAIGQAMVLMVAAFAVLSWIVHPRRRMIEHIVHALYFHAALLPLIALAFAIVRLGGAGEAATVAGAVFGGLGLFWLLYASDRGFYGSSWWGAALRLPLLAFGYFIAIGLASAFLLLLQTF